MNHRMIRLFLVLWCWLGPFSLADASVTSVHEEGSASQIWVRLLDEARHLQLPTKFLKALPPDFIRFEFDDLRAYAALYHPDGHRMVLNRSLSFNAAGRLLKPLGKMTHKELEVLYHELFHAYMDYLTVLETQSGEVGQRSEELLRFAREQQTCRYGEVVITPVVQRTGDMELRYLTQAESWEALNETWAVFVGWAVWNQLEVQRKIGNSMFREQRQADQWIQRLKEALEKGELRGYYVPEDPDERRLAHKRYLAKPSQLTLGEAIVLMEQAFGFSHDFIEAVDLLRSRRRSACPTVKEKMN
jgi:hypothetical protein